MTMTLPSLLAAPDAARAADLRRIKLLATLVLCATLALFVIARLLLHVHPIFGYVAAFAEAATIGGLADWYAAVALFRHPLGLPIPHTAIIPANQNRIADKLGEFVETHFLETAPVEAKLREVDFASFIADWLIDPKRSADLSRFVLKMLPEAFAAAETSGLKALAARQLVAQLNGVDIAPLAAGALRSFIEQQRHQGLLDDLMQAMHDALERPEMLHALRDKIRNELPTLLKLYRTDAFLLNKIVASVTAFFAEVRADPAHPFRAEFDRLVLSLVERFSTDPAYTQRLDNLKRDVLARSELSALADTVWDNARAYVEANASGGVLHDHLSKLFVEAGRALAADADLRGEINAGIRVVAKSFIAEQKSGVSGFIAEQVKSWDMRQLIGVIEVNVGRDLQYIRFNGALIGGLAGLALYAAEVMLRLH